MDTIKVRSGRGCDEEDDDDKEEVMMPEGNSQVTETTTQH
jgi:hypothetical protein